MKVINDIDKEQWSEFVFNHPDGNIFHTPEMMEVFRRAKGFKPKLWAAVGEGEDIQAIFLPVQNTVINHFLLRWLTTRAVLFGSALCAPTPEGKEALDILLSAYNRKIGRSILFTELRNLSDMSDLQPILIKNGLEYEEHLNFLIDLTKSKKEIWNNIRSNAQRNIRKSDKSGVKIEAVTEQSGVLEAYTVLQQVYSRIQVPLPDQSLFQAAFDILYPKGMFKAFLAKVDDSVIGALTLLIYKDVIIYWYTGTLREFSSYRPSDFLVWHALEFGLENKYHTFDFGGGGKPDEEYGVRDFKAKFGGDLVSFGRNKIVHSPLKLQASKVGYELFRKIL